MVSGAFLLCSEGWQTSVSSCGACGFVGHRDRRGCNAGNLVRGGRFQTSDNQQDIGLWSAYPGSEF